jgi:Tfp pilus assembly protein PilF
MKRPTKKTVLVATVAFLLGAIAGGLLTAVLARAVQEGAASSYMFSALEYKENGNLEKAIPYFYYASALQPNWYTPHVELAGIFERKGYLEMALEEYRQALHYASQDQKDTALVNIEAGLGPLDAPAISAKVRELSDRLRLSTESEVLER